MLWPLTECSSDLLFVILVDVQDAYHPLHRLHSGLRMSVQRLCQKIWSRDERSRKSRRDLFGSSGYKNDDIVAPEPSLLFSATTTFSTSCLSLPRLLRFTMTFANSQAPPAPPPPKTRRGSRFLSVSPAVPLRRSPRFTRAPPKSDIPAHVPAILPTGVPAHHCSSQYRLDQATRRILDNSGACSPNALVNSEPDEDMACVSVLPPGTTSASPELLNNSSADNTEPSHVVHPFTATSMAQRLLGGVQVDNLPRPFVSVSRGDIAPGWSSPYTRDIASSPSQLRFPRNTTEDTTYRCTGQHQLSWFAQHHRDGTKSSSPEAVIKAKLENELSNLVAHQPSAGSTTRLPFSNTKADFSKPTFIPKYRDEINYLPEVDPPLNQDEILSRDGKTEIPLLVVPRREPTNTDITEAPSAFPNHPPVPSLSTVTRQTYTTDCFNSMFPWAKYSVELNKPVNIPCIPPLAVNSEPATEEEDFATTDEEGELESGSASEDNGAPKGVKRMRDKTFEDESDESAGDEDEGSRPQRRRKLL